MLPAKNLDDALKTYRTLVLCCEEAMEAVKRDPGPFSRKFSLATETTSQRTKDIRNFFKDFFGQKVTPALEQVCFLDVVRTFESMVFELVGDASGNIKRIVNDSARAKAGKRITFPFQSSADRFVKIKGEDVQNPGDIRYLSDVKDILNGKIPHELYDSLDAIIRYRNWLAHGNRSSERPEYPGDLPHVVKILNDVLREIGT